MVDHLERVKMLMMKNVLQNFEKNLHLKVRFLLLLNFHFEKNASYFQWEQRVQDGMQVSVNMS